MNRSERSSPSPVHEVTAPGSTPSESDRFGIRFVDAEHFSTHRIAPFRHAFDRHPSMRLDRIAALAARLQPTRQCRFVRPGITMGSEFSHQSAPADGRGLDEVFARIEESGSWIALYNVETDPEYRAFLDEVVDSARPRIEREQPGIFNVSGFMFLSAPPSVTPFHIDRENNIWLQIRGRKRMHVWDHRDREVVSGRAVESFIVDRDLSKVRMVDGTLQRARVMDVGPGDGVYWPATTPHMTTSSTDWVVPGDGVSISIGVCFYSRSTRHQARVHQSNRVLRRLGLEPSQPGASAWLDAVKAPLGYAAGTAARLLRGYRPPPGAL